MEIGLEPWGEGDLPLLERLLGDAEMMEHLGWPESPQNAPSNAICRKLGFTLLEELEFEYPPGSFMRCNDWRLNLQALE
jgi:hypothetical protein